MQPFDLPAGKMTSLKITKQGKEKEIVAFAMKIEGIVSADLIDSLWCEDINEGDALRAFWLDTEDGSPRFQFLSKEIKFGRKYLHVACEVMGMELADCHLGEFMFEPIPGKRAKLTFTASGSHPPAFAMDRLSTMLMIAQPIKFSVPDVVIPESEPGAQGDAFAGTEDGPDELYEHAVKAVVGEGVASISFLQRKLRTGYNRAARLMDMMQAKGIVSAPDSSGRREVIEQ